MTERVTTAVLAPDEEELDGSLRPRSLEEFVGQERVKEQLAIALEAATGDFVLHRPLFGKFIGRFFKGLLLGPKPFSRNSPTHPKLVMKEPQDFDRQKARLIAVIRKFHDAGPAAAARFEHAFVGKLTGDEWGVMQHKHLDHHLRQFGAV